MRSGRLDVAVVGGGPAGCALATACAEQGLSVITVAPDHDVGWPNTYGVWTDELLPLDVGETVAKRWPMTVVQTERRTHRLARGYALIDNDRLRQRLRERFAAAGGLELDGTASGAHGDRLLLDDGTTLPAAVIVDATGHRPALLRWPGDPAGFQTAYGVLARCSAPPAEPGVMTLMDVRADALGAITEPTFLYAMDLGEDRWFVQETSLARTEPIAFDVLERGLRRRLAAMDVHLAEEQSVERCVFPLGTPAPQAQPVFGYGAAAGMVHPATGYQVGQSLARAPEVAAALAAAVGNRDDDAALRAWESLWSSDRRRQRALHDLGLACLLRLRPREFERFFDAFFALPEGRWRAYLSEARSAADVRRSMGAVLVRARGVRGTLLSTALGSGRRHALTGLGLAGA